MISIDRLSDDDLLEIFHLYVDEVRNHYVREHNAMEAWQRLVHVCRRWRSVVFGSPRRLKLRLICTDNTLASMVDVWPVLPLVIRVYDSIGSVDNIVGLLKRSDLVCRVSEIKLWKVLLKDISEAMQVPFLELTDLLLSHHGQTEPVFPLPDSFLGGAAPQLRYLYLDRIPYPGLPKLLLSATHLTRLDLCRIPDTGYIPPEAMAASLSTLTSLGRLKLEFQFARPLPDQHPPPSIRTSLPVLNDFTFQGSGEYLEVLVARIDAPRLGRLEITFFNDIVFITPHLTRFISHTPTFEAFNTATVILREWAASVELLSAYAELTVSVSCWELDWQLSFLEQVCTSSLPPLSTLQDLYMKLRRPWPEDWKDNIDYAQWLELFRSFTAVKNLYLFRELAPCVATTLQELVGGRTTEVLPNLQNIFVDPFQESGFYEKGIVKFVAARQVTSHPITVSRW